MKKRGLILALLAGLVATSGVYAQETAGATEEENQKIAPQGWTHARSAAEMLRLLGTEVKVAPRKSVEARSVKPNAVTGTAVSTRSTIANEWVNYQGITTTLGTAETPQYGGSTDVCVRPGRFDSPSSFLPTWRLPSPSPQDGVVEVHRVDTGQLFGIRTLDVEGTALYTTPNGSPGSRCTSDNCATTTPMNQPDIMGLVCEIWSGTNGTTFAFNRYCNQTDIFPGVAMTQFRDGTGVPFNGQFQMSAFRSRTSVNAGLGTYYRVRVGYYTFGDTTAAFSTACDALLTVTHD